MPLQTRRRSWNAEMLKATNTHFLSLPILNWDRDFIDTFQMTHLQKVGKTREWGNMQCAMHVVPL